MKLQRLRDQIKTWLASGEIKDKSTLMENRKLIETQMERFKIVERETKTKAYSKEGLTASTRMDPAERERAEVMQWLNHCIDTLNIQVDQFEAEIESLQGGGKKRKGKSDDAARQEECQVWVDKHRDHIQKLETLLRMLDDTQVEVTQIKDIKEDIDNYIENSQEPDFFENEYIYDDIDGLEEMLLDLGAPEHNSVESSEAGTILPSHQEDLKRRHRSSQSDDSNKVKKNNSCSKEGTTPPSLVAPPSPLPVRPVSSTPTKSSAPISAYCLSQSPNNSSPSSGGPSALLAGLTNHLAGERQNFAAAAATQNGHAGEEPVIPEAPSLPGPSPSPSSAFPKLMGPSLEVGLPQPGSYPHPGPAVQLGGLVTQQPQVNGGTQQPPGLQSHPQQQQQQQKALPESLSSLKSLAQQALSSSGSEGQQQAVTDYQLGLGVTKELIENRQALKTEAHIPPLLGVAPP